MELCCQNQTTDVVCVVAPPRPSALPPARPPRRLASAPPATPRSRLFSPASRDTVTCAFSSLLTMDVRMLTAYV